MDKTERMTAAEFRARTTVTPAGRVNGFTTQPVTPRPKPSPIFTPEVYTQAGSELVIEIEPMGAPRMNKNSRFNPTKTKVIDRYHATKDKVRADCELMGYKLGGVLKVRFEHTMPDSWSAKKKAEHAGRPHQTKPDLDNEIKLIGDSFNVDDSHVHTIQATKIWAYKGRIVIIR